MARMVCVAKFELTFEQFQSEASLWTGPMARYRLIMVDDVNKLVMIPYRKGGGCPTFLFWPSFFVQMGFPQHVEINGYGPVQPP